MVKREEISAFASTAFFFFTIIIFAVIVTGVQPFGSASVLLMCFYKVSTIQGY